MKIDVIIADDHRILREGLAALLSTQGLHIVGQASDGEQAALLARERKPHVILMDVEMPNMDGVAATRIIKQHLPSIKILMLSAFSENERVLEAMQAGASGYVLKRTSPEDLVKIIKATLQGEIFISPYLANLVLSESDSAQAGVKTKTSQTSNVLSPREQTILNLIVNGLGNEAIAETIHTSRDTVKVHLKHIFEKLHVENRTQAAVAAIEHGLLAAS